MGNESPEEIHFVRSGAFYEAAGKDARRAVQVLGLSLNAFGSAGFPVHARHGYTKRAKRQGVVLIFREDKK